MSRYAWCAFYCALPGFPRLSIVPAASRVLPPSEGHELGTSKRHTGWTPSLFNQAASSACKSAAWIAKKGSWLPLLRMNLALHPTERRTVPHSYLKTMFRREREREYEAAVNFTLTRLCLKLDNAVVTQLSYQSRSSLRKVARRTGRIGLITRRYGTPKIQVTMKFMSDTLPEGT